MGRFLNVGVIQMPVEADTVVNLEYLEARLAEMMAGYHKPELVVGIECLECYTPQTIPGTMTEYFSRMAKKYGIYFIPGSIYEIHPDLPKDVYYNSAPVFNPQGELIAVYRKIAPWKPTEEFVQPGREYVVFDIPEKNTKIGVQICYDINFPEISRNEALMGAEVLVKLTMDPEELYLLNKHLHYARAIENQAYVVSTNVTGFFDGGRMYGNSMIVSPEGHAVWETGSEPTYATVTLDLDMVSRARRYGTIFMDHYLQHLRDFKIPMPFASDVSKAPVYKNLPPAPQSIDAYEEEVKPQGVCVIGKRIVEDMDCGILEEKLDAYLSKKLK